MHHCVVVLMGVATLVASVNATLYVKATEKDLAVRLVQSEVQDVSNFRLLRTQNFAEEGDEERASFSIKSIPGVDKISSLMTNQKVAKWL
ncbi:hypothetical protein PI124_g22473 [Phytophthora idaei]|nr:hypothetical protein PI125_g24210 [Phytophthora idaei]KAG3232445.1 hypothetical protein PI124_g22473 [Phytophthora idaei]